MARRKNTTKPGPTVAATPFDQARDELFQHIMTCGVIGADPEHQDEWFTETLKYFSERFPELNQRQLDELKTLGLRFAQPPKSRRKEPAEFTAA